MGQVYVKIREYVQTKDKHFWSSPRGINLRVKEWKQLVELMPVISEAVSDLDVSFFLFRSKSRVRCIKGAKTDFCSLIH